MSKLSKDPAVQESLRQSLSKHLEKQDILMVPLEDSEDGAATEKYSEEVIAPLFHNRVPPLSTGFHHLDWTGTFITYQGSLHYIPMVVSLQYMPIIMSLHIKGCK